jgi:hypothetical protein
LNLSELQAAKEFRDETKKQWAKFTQELEKIQTDIQELKNKYMAMNARLGKNGRE